MSDLQQVHQFLSQVLHRSGEAAFGITDAECLVTAARTNLIEVAQGSTRPEVQQAMAEYTAVSEALTQLVARVRAADEQVMAYQASL